MKNTNYCDASLIKIECDGMEFLGDKRILQECIKRISGKTKPTFKNYDDMIKLLKKYYLYNKEFLENITNYRLTNNYSK